MPTFSEPPSVDMTAPAVSTFNPTDESFGVSLGANLVVTFSEAVQRGSGNITLTNAAGALIATYDAAVSSNLSITGSTLTINPTSDLSYSTGYKLEFASGSIKDLAGNNYAGSTDYNFTTLANTPDQTFTGSSGNESFISSSGNDTINGGSGIDTAVYSSAHTNFSLTKTSSGFIVVDNTHALGTDTLTNIDRLHFSDLNIALDVASNQFAGETVLLLGAVLPRGLVLSVDPQKQALLGDVIDLFDTGLYSLKVLSGAVMRLHDPGLWDVLTGNASPTNTDIAKYLLTNVNGGGAPDKATLDAGVAALDAQPDYSPLQGDFLYQLTQSSSFQARVGLVGLAALADTGLQYL